MEKISEDLSRLEQNAQELVTKLRVLNEEIGSYKQAKDSLEVTNQRLESLIETTKNLSQESASIITKFNEISGASFIERTENTNKRIGDLKNALNTNQQRTEEVNDKLSEIKVEVLSHLDASRKRTRRILLIVCVGVFVIIALLILKTFFVDKDAFLQFVSNLKSLI